jgi:hypothetical protein
MFFIFQTQTALKIMQRDGISSSSSLDVRDEEKGFSLFLVLCLFSSWRREGRKTRENEMRDREGERAYKYSLNLLLN